MNLSFDSIDELELIIAAMGYVKQPFITVQSEITQAPTPTEPSVAVLREMLDPIDSGAGDEVAQGNESAPAGELAAGATTGSTESAADTAASEAPKRKRRTKAEMEAARAAETQAENGFIMEASQATSGDATNAASGNPFEANAASPTTQAILNAPNQQAATLAGIAAMQQSPFDAPAAESTDTATAALNAGAVTPGDATGYIETRSLEILSTQTEPLTAVKHMHFCREFIAKHKQEKYLQGFALAGLSSAIGAYKPEQCARHQAALEFLEMN